VFFYLGCSSSFIVSRFPDERLQKNFFIDFFEKLRKNLKEKNEKIDFFDDLCLKKSKKACFEADHCSWNIFLCVESKITFDVESLNSFFEKFEKEQDAEKEENEQIEIVQTTSDESTTDRDELENDTELVESLNAFLEESNTTKNDIKTEDNNEKFQTNGGNIDKENWSQWSECDQNGYRSRTRKNKTNGGDGTNYTETTLSRC